MAEQKEAVEFEPQNLNLICVDASEHSKRAFNWYFENLHHEGDQIGLVHVYVPPDLPPFSVYAGGMAHISVFEETMRESIDDSKEIVAVFKAICIQKGVTPKYFVKSINDSVGNTVCEIAKENKANMIVIGQRGLGKIRRTFLGSNSDYIVHHTKVPVLLVPPQTTEK